MFADTDPRSLPGSIIHFNRLLNDIAISQILGNESAQRPLEFVIRFMSKLSLKIRWTSTLLLNFAVFCDLLVYHKPRLK